MICINLLMFVYCFDVSLLLVVNVFLIVARKTIAYCHSYSAAIVILGDTAHS